MKKTYRNWLLFARRLCSQGPIDLIFAPPGAKFFAMRRYDVKIQCKKIHARRSNTNRFVKIRSLAIAPGLVVLQVRQTRRVVTET